MLAGLRERIQLELVDRHEFRSGAVAVRYRPASATACPRGVCDEPAPDVPVELWALCVRSARRRSGLSQGELASATDVTQQTISKVEAGTICPHDALKVRLASALGLPPGALFP